MEKREKTKKGKEQKKWRKEHQRSYIGLHTDKQVSTIVCMQFVCDTKWLSSDTPTSSKIEQLSEVILPLNMKSGGWELDTPTLTGSIY